MEKNRLNKFKITKLFGYQNVEIDFDSNYKIIIGENGLGKTTVLNCLFYVLDKRFKKLNSIVFESIELIFSNKSKVSFTKNDLEFYLDKSKIHQGSQFYQILKKDLKKEDIQNLKNVIKSKKITEQERRLIVVATLKKIGVNINAPSQFIYETINKFISESESLNFQNIIETLDENITIYESLEDLKNKIDFSKGFRCPACGGVSKNPYKCDSGQLINDEKVCDWKAYGLFGTMGKGFTFTIKDGFLENPKVDDIFYPVSLETEL